MKNIIYSILIFTLFFIPAITYAENLDRNSMLIFVQTIIRDSDGNLITYLESTKFTNLDIEKLELFLDHETSLGNDPIINLEGNQYQIIRRAQSQTFSDNNVIASVNLWDNIDGELSLLARFAHDGFPVTEGDSMKSIWTFVRPV